MKPLRDRIAGNVSRVLISLTMLSLIAGWSVWSGVSRADEPPAVTPVPLASMFRADDPVLSAARERDEAAHRRLLAALDSPASREDREDSRDEFADLPDSQAVALARSTFGDELTGPTEDAPTLANGLRIVDYRDQYTALVETATGKPYGIMESSTPLTTDPQGDERISLDLQADGNGFAPERPRVDVDLPATADEPTALPEAGLTFAPVGADDVVAVQRGDRVLYPSIAPDTDYIVQPTELGAESFWQLRSADSPDTMRLRYTLPEGATLEDRSLLGQGITAAIVKDGQVLGAVKPVTAVDAAGRPVATSVEVAGNDLVIRAKTHSPDVQFPVLVDPTTESWYGTQVAGCGWGSPSGMWNQEQLGSHSFDLNCNVNVPWLGTGMFIAAPTSRSYSAYDAFQLNYWPRANTYISTATFTNFRHLNPYQTYAYTGLYCDNCGYWQSIDSNAWGNNGQTITHYNEALNANRAVIGLQFYSAAAGHNTFSSVEGVYLVIKDGQAPAPPTIESDSPAPIKIVNGEKYYGWNVNPSFRAYGSDPGLGIINLSILRDGDNVPLWGPFWFDKNGYETSNAVCTGSRANPCPNWNTYAGPHAELQNLREGDNVARLVATDAGGRYTDGSRVHIRRDTTPPSLSLSGEAFTNRSVGYAHNSELTVVAADAGSGVNRVTVTIDAESVPLERTSPDCTGDGCSQTVVTAVDAYELDEGPHTINVQAFDNLGRSSSTGWTTSVLPSDGTNTTSYFDDSSAPNDPNDFPTRLWTGTHPALSPGGLGWGIADGEWTITGDADFKAFRANTRIVIPWDLMLRDPGWRRDQVLSGQLPQASHFPLEPARGDGYGRALGDFRAWYGGLSEYQKDNAMVVFEHHRDLPQITEDDAKYRPNDVEFRSAFEAFRRTYPRIRLFGTWNEPNHPTQPTRPAKKDKGTPAAYWGGIVRAGEYWALGNSMCKAPPAGLSTCTAVAGEFIDDAFWNRDRGGTILEKYLQGMGNPGPGDVDKWSWHSYTEGVGYRTKPKKGRQLGEFLGRPATPPRLRYYAGMLRKRFPAAAIWITETAGQRHIYKDLRLSPELATSDEQWLLNTLPTVSSSIERIYHYGYIRSTTSTKDYGLKDFDSTNGPNFGKPTTKRDTFDLFAAKACMSYTPAAAATSTTPARDPECTTQRF